MKIRNKILKADESIHTDLIHNGWNHFYNFAFYSGVVRGSNISLENYNFAKCDGIINRILNLMLLLINIPGKMS